MHRYRLKDFHSKGQISKSLQDHLRIVRAIQEGDEGQAAYHMMQHVPAGASGFSEFLARMPMSFFESETQNN
jgi:DNA-binding FadR family transcriptional regulator